MQHDGTTAKATSARQRQPIFAPAEDVSTSEPLPFPSFLLKASLRAEPD
jgi:hypothetical protein